MSVIMPSYNHAPFVGEAVQSVLTQSFEDFEFIITDDGSSDGTADVIGGFTDSRIVFERFSENQGASEATNRCLERARGEYVALINSDDYFLPGKLSCQIAILDAAPEVAAVFGMAKFVDDDGATIPFNENPYADAFSTAPVDRFAWLRRFFFTGNALCHPTMMIRKRIYDELGMYNVALRQLPDLDMWIRVCARYPIRVLPEPLIVYRVLRGLRNTSAASPSQVRRTVWEYTRVLRAYWLLDDATLKLAFDTDIPENVALSGLPMTVQLALMVAAGRSDLDQSPAHQLFALETMENALARFTRGIRPKDLHKLTGALDPFGIAARKNDAFTTAQPPRSRGDGRG